MVLWLLAWFHGIANNVEQFVPQKHIPTAFHFFPYAIVLLIAYNASAKTYNLYGFWHEHHSSLIQNKSSFFPPTMCGINHVGTQYHTPTTKYYRYTFPPHYWWFHEKMVSHVGVRWVQIGIGVLRELHTTFTIFLDARLNFWNGCALWRRLYE